MRAATKMDPFPGSYANDPVQKVRKEVREFVQSIRPPVNTAPIEPPPAAQGIPAIDSISPVTAVLPSSAVVLNGNNFSKQSTVYLDGLPMVTQYVSDVRLNVTLVAGVARAYSVTVRNRDKLSNARTFTFT